MDVHFDTFLSKTFEKDAQKRPSAKDCFQLGFFQNYNIPKALHPEVLSVPINPDYDEMIHVMAAPQIYKSFENMKYSDALQMVFKRLNAILRFHSVSNFFLHVEIFVGYSNT